MRLRSQHSQPRHAVAAVELAIVLIFLIPLLLYGLWEVGRIVEVSQILANAAREGGRQASTGQLSDTDVQAVVREYIQNEGLPTQNVIVTVTNLGYPGNPPPTDNNPQDATDLDRIQVTVTIPFQDVQWINITLVTGPGSQLSESVIWSSMKDRAYPVPVPPTGS
jgi:Flp pilus assembly protein TadG